MCMVEIIDKMEETTLIILLEINTITNVLIYLVESN